MILFLLDRHQRFGLQLLSLRTLADKFRLCRFELSFERFHLRDELVGEFELAVDRFGFDREIVSDFFFDEAGLPLCSLNGQVSAEGRMRIGKNRMGLPVYYQTRTSGVSSSSPLVRRLLA